MHLDMAMKVERLDVRMETIENTVKADSAECKRFREGVMKQGWIFLAAAFMALASAALNVLARR